MINKYEAVGIFVCVGAMAFALFLTRVHTSVSLLGLVPQDTQVASVVNAGDKEKDTMQLKNTLEGTLDMRGTVKDMTIDDISIGNGAEVKEGDTVTVNYIGTLQNGQEFDNSYKKGEPFTFKVGAGRVIKGWDKGLVGMKVGGQRILVIPSDLAYGASAVGPIPANATLVFAIELTNIK